MHLKYLPRAGAVFALLCGPAFPAAAPDTSAPQIHVVEQIIAKVNGEIITQTELEKQRDAIRAELVKNDPSLSGARLEAAVKEKQADALRDQIDSLLLVQRAKDLSINVDPEVTRKIAQIQAESKIADAEEFHKWVMQQTGQPFEDVRNSMRNQILTQRVIGQEIAQKVQMPKAELKDYYDKHKTEFVRKEMVFLREILISPKSDSATDVAAAEKKAKDVDARARKGEKFGDLARSYSDAPTAAQDGELGSYTRGQLRKEIEDIVFKANRGYISEPLHTSTGFVILKVDDRYEAGQASFEDVQNDITERLYSTKMQPEIRKYLTKLRADAFIEIRGGYIDSGAAPGKDTRWQDPATLKPETTTKAEVTARHKKRVLGVIPRRAAKVSSSEPGLAGKLPDEKPNPGPPVPPGSSSSVPQ